MDTYEKKYNEALERARQIKDGKDEWRYSDLAEITPALTEIFPELRESEGERIRKMCITAVNIAASADGGLLHHEAKQCLDWLEKQKENPKSADFIPSDCVSDAKCENRWHKTANSLPDDGRDVLAKDALGNYLLASFDGAQWFVSVYDGQDHPVLHTPPILEWCDIETCEESLHISETCKENASSFTDEDERIRKWIIEELEITRDAMSGKNPYSDDPDIVARLKRLDEAIAYLEKQKGQKPAEWSEEEHCKLDTIEKVVRLAMEEELGGYTKGQYEDMAFFLHTKVRPQKWQTWSEEEEDMRLEAIRVLESGCERYRKESGCLPSWHKVINWLKSLRPLPKVELSEDVKKTLDDVSHILIGLNYKQIAKDYKQAVEKLLSLRPHPHWKPSEEQMKALDYAIQILDDGLSPKAAKAGEELEHLREQLKKL